MLSAQDGSGRLDLSVISLPASPLARLRVAVSEVKLKLWVFVRLLAFLQLF